MVALSMVDRSYIGGVGQCDILGLGVVVGVYTVGGDGASVNGK